jgi:type II secretory pathway pseudopilin PulG
VCAEPHKAATYLRAAANGIIDDESGPMKRDREKGVGLLETVAAMTIAAVAAATAVHAFRATRSAARMEMARVTLVLTLLEARRTAYVGETDIDVALAIGSEQVQLVSGGETLRTVALPAGAYIAGTNRRARVSFQPTGLADNATIRIADRDGGNVEVVVNQRSMVH